MITKKTVLVLGAGASMAYGLPSGPELKAKVVHQLGQPNTILLLERLGQDRELIDRFREDLMQSHPSSIDAYLASRDDYINIGKMAIAATLIPLERRNQLFQKWYEPYTNPSVDHPDNGHWYQELCGMMEPMIDLEENKLAVITFNYDRSLEYYLYTCLRNLYNPEQIAKEDADSECAEKVKAIPIIHVYGQLGALPWDNSGKYQVPYNLSGLVTKSEIVLEAARCLEIMPEARQGAPVFNQTYELIEKADRIYFLGFGFDPTNVRRLLPPRLLQAKRDYMYGTFCGLSRPRRQFFAHYGFAQVWHDLDGRAVERLPACRFRDQKICGWLRENNHSQFD